MNPEVYKANFLHSAMLLRCQRIHKLLSSRSLGLSAVAKLEIWARGEKLSWRGPAHWSP